MKTDGSKSSMQKNQTNEAGSQQIYHKNYSKTMREPFPRKKKRKRKNKEKKKRKKKIWMPSEKSFQLPVARNTCEANNNHKR